MSKISSTSKIHKSRIHNNYVERNHRVTGAKSVNRVNPIDSIENNAGYSSGNYLYATDAFYDKLEKLSKEYKRFYHREKDLEQAIEDMDSNSDKLLECMTILVEKYNKAITALQSLEDEIGTNNSLTIKDILLSYQAELNDVGISIINDINLSINKETFLEQVINKDDILNTLFRPIRGMITKLYKVFRNISIPNKEAMEKQYNEIHADGFSERDYSGLLMDVKS